MHKGPLPKYRAMVEAGEIKFDGAQLLAAEKLQLLANRLSVYKPPSKTDLYSFFTRRQGEVPEGLYIFGGVGRGKTMLMDLFYESVSFEPKQRVHFHEFMSEVHDAIGRFRKTHDGDPIPFVAKEVAESAHLLCFDEFHVTDIADAMILGRLFAGLFEAHVIVVTTSNVSPQGLYKDGLNRGAFLPFIKLLEERMEVLELEALKDYRLEKFQGQKIYFTPADANAREALKNVWKQLTAHESGEPCELKIKGRTLTVPRAAMGVAWFTFSDLCETALGPLDYLAIAHTFHTVMIEGIPVLGPEKRNEARRFVTLIDALYDNGVRLVASADAEPDTLYNEGDGSFLFERTASRLIEMRSQDYLAGKKAESL